MGMDMKLQFKLSQQLVMTPQLVQAIRLLQLSRMELVDEVRKELDGNPVLADDLTDPQARTETDRTLPLQNASAAPLVPIRIRRAAADRAVPHAPEHAA